MSLTDDPTNPELQETKENGQQKAYLVLSDEERAKGYVRPVRETYVHVGIRPHLPLRELTAEEHDRYDQFGYVKFEKYPDESPINGRYWTQKMLDTRGCGTPTTMNLSIAETYARQPGFYGSTFCSRCGTHLPVEEFVWQGTDEVVGS